MLEQDGAEIPGTEGRDETNADTWRCPECGHLNDAVRKSCFWCRRDRTSPYHPVAPKGKKLNKASLGLALVIALLGAPLLTYSFSSLYYSILTSGTGLVVFMSTPFCAVFVMILVAVVMVNAARREAKQPLLYGLLTAVVAYLILWIAGYIFVATY